MRIAVLERFSDPSRRCDRTRIGSDADEIVLLDLVPEPGERTPSWVEVARSLGSWVALREPLRDRCKLFWSSARMRGTRRSALVRVPGWVQRVRAGEFDQIACYSARGFELASWFAEATGRPCYEQLARGTHYFGEFAFEQLAVIPYAYWLHQQGRLEFTASTSDTACFYYFSPDHTEVAVERRLVHISEYPVTDLDDAGFDREGFPAVLDTAQWRPPPYREVYADDGRFRFDKPPVIVCNKANAEPYERGRFAVNVLDTSVLLALARELTPRFTVVYNRPRACDIVPDHAEIRELGDIEALKHAFPDVITIQELHAEHPDLTFNELQLRLFATCERFVSVLGGASYLASYFGGTNVVYAQVGWEVGCRAYDGWFHLFSGARVVAAATPDELLRAVRTELLDEVCVKLVRLFPAWTRRGMLIRTLVRKPVLYGPDTIWQHFAARHPDVVFVQIGSGNGKTGDPLFHWINRYPSWQGTMVEPAPRGFARLVERRGGDPRFRLVCAAITDHDGRVELHIPADNSLRSSLDVGELVDVEGPIESTTVPAMTFATLTDGMERIDLLQIDAEGHDAVILDQVDLETVRPAVIMYESERLSTADQEQTTSRLRAAGYRVTSDDFDTIAIRDR